MEPSKSTKNKNNVDISKSLKTILLSKSETATIKLAAKTTQSDDDMETSKMSNQNKIETPKGSSRRHKKTESSSRTKKHGANRSRRRQTHSTTTSDEESSDASQPKPGISFLKVDPLGVYVKGQARFHKV